MSKKLFKNWWMLLIAGILFCFLGVVYALRPDVALLTTGMFFGVTMLVAGILITAFAFSFSGTEGWGWRLAEGIIDILFGALLLCNLDAAAISIPIVIGFWAIFRGIMVFVDSFSYKKIGMSDWWGFMLLGAIGVLFGFGMLSNLFAAALATGWLIGVVMLSIGISAIFYSIKMSKVTVDAPQEWAKKLADAYKRLKSDR